MLAIATKSKRFAALLPDRSPHPRASVSRRTPSRPRARRRNPLVRVLVVAAVVFFPAVTYVSQRTEAASSGYAILRLRGQVAALQSDNARLLATVTALKSPERIEQIAVDEMGMVAPKPQQLSALRLAPVAVATRDIPGASTWPRIVTWLGLGEAEARETD